MFIERTSCPKNPDATDHGSEALGLSRVTQGGLGQCQGLAAPALQPKNKEVQLMHHQNISSLESLGSSCSLTRISPPSKTPHSKVVNSDPGITVLMTE